MIDATDLAEPDRSSSLLDYRRRVGVLYQQVRDMGAGEEAWWHWRRTRDDLFRSHPQSPVPPRDRATFTGLDYFPFDPALRLELPVLPIDSPGLSELGHSGPGSTWFRRIGRVSVPLDDGRGGAAQRNLVVHWLEGYGGGLFLAFRDRTNGVETYGGGRHLLDSAKGADLGGAGNRLVIDFNFAFHASCVHNPQWSCPLPPAGNDLTVPIPGGERLPRIIDASPRP